MAIRRDIFKVNWRRVRTSARFRSVLVFLVFIAVSALFWLILALNDSVTRSLSVRINVENVPDSVTFINDPPRELHITLRDKGTNLLRSSLVKNPSININFRDYADNGIFRVGRSEMTALIKTGFSSGTSIVSTSVDSIRCYYTEGRGKRVPVVIRADVTASSGNLISGKPVALQRGVRVYSYGNETDTINQVYTQVLVRRDLSQTQVFDVKIKPIPGVRIVPPEVGVQVKVEPLVHKEGYAEIETRGVPLHEGLLLFPNRVPVSYYVPMSMFNESETPVRIVVEYSDTKATRSNKIPVRLTEWAEYVVSPELHADSVEYTLIRK